MSHVNTQGKVVLSSKNINGYKIYPLTPNLVDIFWGEGFTNNARYKWSNGEWILWKKTKSIPHDLINTLIEYKKGEK